MILRFSIGRQPPITLASYDSNVWCFRSEISDWVFAVVKSKADLNHRVVTAERCTGIILCFTLPPSFFVANCYQHCHCRLVGRSPNACCVVLLLGIKQRNAAQILYTGHQPKQVPKQIEICHDILRFVIDDIAGE